MLFGAISSGLGEINEYNFLKKLHLPLAIASGTSVFIVAVSAFTGIIIHTILSVISGNKLPFPTDILLFIIPGVITGGQLGVIVSQKISLENARIFIGSLFFLLSAMVLATIV